MTLPVSTAHAALLLEQIAWGESGLVPAIAQEAGSGQVLMLAWMNRDAFAQTLTSGFATYWSRSRGKLWRKGEESGHLQVVEDIRLDCDNDTVLLRVEQQGGIACHTGRHHCFFQKLDQGRWHIVDAVQKDPQAIYRSSDS